MVFGKCVDGSDVGRFQQSVQTSFVSSLVQCLHESTFDTSRYLQPANDLWAVYIEPLSKKEIQKTIAAAKRSMGDTIDKSMLEKEIVSILDKKFFSRARELLSRGQLESPRSMSTQCHDFAPLTKFLLLSAFLCQNNRAESDKRLFVIQKNGQRRRNSVPKNDDEDVAFGKNDDKAKQKRSFPLERMMSVYVSLVNLHGDAKSKEDIQSLGSSQFYENLMNLSRIGLVPESRNITMLTELNAPPSRYCCQLTRSEAFGIARSLSFPLDRYLL